MKDYKLLYDEIKKKYDELVRKTIHDNKCIRYGKIFYEGILTQIRKVVRKRNYIFKEHYSSSIKVYIPSYWHSYYSGIYIENGFYGSYNNNTLYHKLIVNKENFNIKYILKEWERLEDKERDSQNKENNESNYEGLTNKESLGDPF